MNAEKTRKPTIQEIFEAFKNFQSQQIKIMSTQPFGNWEKEFWTIREILKAELERLGLAEHIDWTNLISE